jgi:hypothetical protein
MSRYVSLLSFREYLSSTNDLGTSQDGLLQDCLDNAESQIDGYTRRNFLGTAGTYYVNRYDQAVRSQALYLREDICALVSLTNGDGQVIPVGSVWLEPRNSGPPWRMLRLHSSYVYVWNTDSDVIVAGTFGFGTVVPPDIAEATKQLAAFYFRGKDIGPMDVSGNQDVGQVVYPRGMPDTVKMLIDKYRSRTGGAV